MDIPLNIRQAYSEVDSILELLDEEDRNKVPKKLRQLFKIEKDNEYVKYIDVNKDIEEQDLKEETLALIALLNLKYWCEDEKEKEELKKVYNQNEEIHQEELKQRYNSDNLFRKSNDVVNTKLEAENNETNLIEYKESIIRKIINKIKKLFKYTSY